MSKIRHFFKKKPQKKFKKKKDKFYSSKEWKEIRYEVLKSSNGHCSLCGKKAGDKLESGEHVKLTVEHLLPRSIYPMLGTYKPNLCVRCMECNVGKDSIIEPDLLWIYEQWKTENDFD